MPRNQVAGRTAAAIQPVRGNITRLASSGSPYLARLPGPDAPRVLDLFCGAGGLSLGFALAGFHIAGGIDADAWAMETHAYNFGGHDKPIMLSETFEPEDALHALGIEQVDVLIGGPPCQGFARVGLGKIRSLKRLEMTDDDVLTWDDPRNRLYRAYLRFVHLLKPKFLVMENVPDMARHSNGETVSAIIADLEDMGYTAERFVLNASEYGVPQTRQRLFIVANRVGLAVNAPVKTSEHRPVTLKQAIGDLPPVQAGELADDLPYRGPVRSQYGRMMRAWLEGADRKVVYDHMVRYYAEDDRAAFRFLEPGQRYRDLPPELQRYRTDVFDDKYHKLMWDKPSWTITAHIAKDGYKYIHPDLEQVRTITAREAARIQSFPDWFRFAGFRSHRLKQIGNAVPPLLAKAIADVVMAQLNGDV